MTNDLNAKAPMEKRRLKSSDFSDKGNHFQILVQAFKALLEDFQDFFILGEKEQGYPIESKVISGECDYESIRKRVSLSTKFLLDDMEWVSQNGYPPISHYCGLKSVFDFYVAKRSGDVRDQKQATLLLDQIHASQAALILQGHVDLAQDIFNAAGAFARLDQALNGSVQNPFDGPQGDISKIRILFKFQDFLAKSQIPSQKALRNAVGKDIDEGQFSRAIKGMHIKMVIPEEIKKTPKGLETKEGTVYSLEALSPNFDEIKEAQEIAAQHQMQVTSLEHKCPPRSPGELR